MCNVRWLITGRSLSIQQQHWQRQLRGFGGDWGGQWHRCGQLRTECQSVCDGQCLCACVPTFIFMCAHAHVRTLCARVYVTYIFGLLRDVERGECVKGPTLVLPVKIGARRVEVVVVGGSKPES